MENIRQFLNHADLYLEVYTRQRADKAKKNYPQDNDRDGWLCLYGIFHTHTSWAFLEKSGITIDEATLIFFGKVVKFNGNTDYEGWNWYKVTERFNTLKDRQLLYERYMSESLAINEEKPVKI